MPDFQFCNSPLIIGHYRGKIGNGHTDNRQKRNVLYMIRKSTLKIHQAGLETANCLTSEVSISHSIHAVQWFHKTSRKQFAKLSSLSFNPEDKDPWEASLWDAKMLKQHLQILSRDHVCKAEEMVQWANCLPCKHELMIWPLEPM